MTPATRLFMAISGGKPDRVPVVPKMWVDLAAGIIGTPLTEIVSNPETAIRVMTDAGIVCGFDAVRVWHFPEKKIRETGGVVTEYSRDGKPLGKIDMLGGLVTHLDDPRDFVLEDPWFMAHHHYWTCDRPIVESVTDVERIYIPTSSDYVRFGWAERIKKQLARVGDKLAIVGDCDSPTLAACISFRGMDNALMDMIDNPGLVDALMDRMTGVAIERGKFNLGMGLRILRLNDSAGNMSVISPALWRRFIKPRFKRFCDEIHAYDKDAKIYCHICGNIMPIVEDLIETGLDCIAPLDPLGGVSASEIRRVVGSRVSLMGGVNTLSFINNTPSQIMEEARACIEGAGRDGGYILGSGCVIPRSAKKENLIALVEAAEKYGRY